MKVLVACEFSGIVRNAFAKLGHQAFSCDLLPTESIGRHYQQDIRTLDLSQFDLMIAHPPCTYLASSGARWFKNRVEEQDKALEFVSFLLNAPINKIALENPVGVISSRIRKPDQIIQPYHFGYHTSKATCLWLKNLPLLKPTNIVIPYRADVHYESPGPDRWKNRSRTKKNIAKAMAEQWGLTMRD